jgi:hypothetical protein
MKCDHRRRALRGHRNTREYRLGNLPTGAVNRAGATLLGLALAACASNPQRPAESSLGCMKSVRDSLPVGIPDARAHCLAAGGIAQRCSGLEAKMAGAGKEFADLFTGGDPSWADWQADKAGIRCAREHRDSDGLAACCAASGF